MNYFGTYIHTYLRTHVQVIFQGRHPTPKLLKQKVPNYDTSPCSKFFIWPKSKKRPTYSQKPCFFYQELRFIFKLTLLKISLLFPKSSLRGRFFSSENRSRTTFDSLFSPDIFLLPPPLPPPLGTP